VGRIFLRPSCPPGGSKECLDVGRSFGQHCAHGTRPGNTVLLGILVTGGSDGVGLPVAKLLAAEGDTRVTLVERSETKPGKAVAQLPGAGHDFVAADLARPEGIDPVARRLAARH
jgi:short-subunit dehydrogenase involved in D-alanine esterification of teichoic acids